MPPHVFAVEPGRLAYGRFPHGDHGLEAVDFHEVELTEGLFGEGPLGGPLLDASAFREAISSLVRRGGGSVSEASLLLPDAWLRLSFATLEDLPRGARKREEALRWKLRKLVPFRVEELRVRSTPVAPLPGQEDSHRFLLGFALQQLLEQLETAFADEGVLIGQITNQSLGLASALRGVVESYELAVVAGASMSGYSLIVMRGGEPTLHRFKSIDPTSSSEVVEAVASRDLSLTRGYLEEQLGGRDPERVLLSVAAEEAEEWRRRFESGLGWSTILIGSESLPVSAGFDRLPLSNVAPMVGVASKLVA